MNKGSITRTVIVSQSPDNSGNFVCSGAADEVEINAAITYVNARGGGEVILLEGTYVLAGSVLPLSNVTLSGQGAATLLDTGVAAVHAIDINAQTYVKIRDLSVQTTAAGGNAVNAINIQGASSYIMIDSVVIPESDQDGIAITSTVSEVFITQSGVFTPDRYGVNCDGNDCRIRETEFGGSGDDGIFLDANSDGCFVISNHIHTWTNEPIDDDGDNTVERNLCVPAGGEVVAWNSKGCGFDDVQEAIDHQVSNGEITIEPGTHTVAGGVITLAVANTGLQIKGAGKLVTTLSSSTRHCIQLTAVTNCVIRDLAFQTTGVAVAADGVALIGACVAVFIIDCVCLDSDQDAISIAAASNQCFIRRNYLYANIDRYGINLSSDDCVISGNRVNGTGDNGIYLQAGGTNNIVVENRVSGWVGEAIDNDDSSNNVSHNNTTV